MEVFSGGLNHRKIIQLLMDVLPSGKQTVCELENGDLVC
jgi:hypothetical protein